MSEPVNRRLPWRPRRPFFDDEGPYLDRFGLLLALTTLAVVAQALVDLSAVPSDLGAALLGLLITLLVGGTLLVALRASGVARRRQIGAEVLVGLVLLGNVLLVVATLSSESGAADGRQGGAALSWLLLSLAAPVVTARRLLQHRTVTASTLRAAISAYLLLALASYYAFQTVNSFQATPFFGEPQPTTAFMYFSLATITTVGYGDLAPVTALGRLVATSEAVIGQVYLVTIVAMVVGLLAQNWRPRREE